MKTFFCTGLPRSRTGWLANLLTQGDSFCFLELFAQTIGMDAFELRMKDTGCPVVGVSEPSLLLLWQEVNARVPGSPWVLIERDPLESLNSFQRVFPQCPANFIDNLVAQMKALAVGLNGQLLHVPYDKLDDYQTCAVIVGKCTGQKLSRERWRLLDSLNVTQNGEKYRTKYMLKKEAN